MTHAQVSMSAQHHRTESLTVIRNKIGEVLLVEKPHGVRKWELPGGTPVTGERPHIALQRTVYEETGLTSRPDALLAVDRTQDTDSREETTLIWDGGTLPSGASGRTGHRYVNPDDLDHCTTALTARRIRETLHVLSLPFRCTVHLENGHLLSGSRTLGAALGTNTFLGLVLGYGDVYVFLAEHRHGELTKVRVTELEAGALRHLNGNESVAELLRSENAPATAAHQLNKSFWSARLEGCHLAPEVVRTTLDFFMPNSPGKDYRKAS